MRCYWAMTPIRKPTSEPPIHLVYALEGDLYEVDVFKLAPTLLHLGQLIQDSNTILNPAGEKVAVNVRPFREGSFLVDLILFPATPEGQQVIGAIASSAGPSILEVIRSVGIVANTGKSVIDVIRQLGRRPESSETLKNGDVKLTAGEKSVVTNYQVSQLIKADSVVQNVFNIYHPLDSPGVKAVKSYLAGQEQETTVELTADELTPLRTAAEKPPPLDQTRTTTNRSTQFLKPKRGAFIPDGRSWSFYKGKSIIQATVRDEVFLAKHAAGLIPLKQGDTLKVEMIETQEFDGLDIHSRIEILRVLEHIPAPRQGDLLDES